ncbi:hypothetical protein [Paenibacillus elgii]|uniref:hypothetical protein n=1 Tax=Paenibacillus elgii TaxID=189691 RepID=UPI000248D238|nr:hypothetical protein [Paenibacillus elgii]
MNLTTHDKYLLDKMIKEKRRYKVIVDNDAVYIQDLQDEEEDNWIPFDQYGYEFIVSLFEYLGFQAEFV